VVLFWQSMYQQKRHLNSAIDKGSAEYGRRARVLCITCAQPDLCSFKIAMKSGAAALICRNMGNSKLVASSKCFLNHFCWVSLSQNSNLGRQTTVKIWQTDSAMPDVQMQDYRCFCRTQSLFEMSNSVSACCTCYRVF